MSPLGRDAVEIHRAGRAEEFDAAVFDVLDAVDAIGVGNDARQNGLPFDQRQTAQVAPIELEHIKRHVVGPVGTKPQMVESTATVGAETDDLSVEHGIRAAYGMRKLGTQVRPRREDMTTTRNQLTVMAADVGERANPLYFTSYRKSGWSNGCGIRSSVAGVTTESTFRSFYSKRLSRAQQTSRE